MTLNACGKAARMMWLNIPEHYPSVELDEYVIMPNHIHGIVIINSDNVGNEKIRSLHKTNLSNLSEATLNHEYVKDDYVISTDKSRLKIDIIHGFLKDAYWCKNIPVEIVKRSIEGSLCYGVYKGDKQVGFARVITDYSVIAFIADVFILEGYRGQGLSMWLMQCLIDNPDLQELRGWSLKTKDAHGLYSKFGFKAPENPELIMERKIKSSY